MLSPREERRFGIIHVAAAFMHSDACLYMFNQLQLTVVMAEYDNEKKDVSVGVVSALLPKVAHGDISPEYQVELNQHTDVWEFKPL